MSTFQEKYLDFDITLEHEVNSGWVKSDLEQAVGAIAKKPGENKVKAFGIFD